MNNPTECSPTVPAPRTAVEGFRAALIRRCQSRKCVDEECATLAEELIEEVSQTPSGDIDAGHRSVQVGNYAMGILEDPFWKSVPKQKSSPHLPVAFPKTKGVLVQAVLDGWENAFNTHGDFRKVQIGFAHFVATHFASMLISEERNMALSKLREHLRDINPPVGWWLVCGFIEQSQPLDDPEVIRIIGRSFGHFARQRNLLIAVRAILEKDPQLKDVPMHH